MHCIEYPNSSTRHLIYFVTTGGNWNQVHEAEENNSPQSTARSGSPARTGQQLHDTVGGRRTDQYHQVS